MDRGVKRQRSELNCGGTRCSHPECSTCTAPPSVPQPAPQAVPQAAPWTGPQATPQEALQGRSQGVPWVAPQATAWRVPWTVREAGPLYSTMISRLDDGTIRAILGRLAVNNPAVQSEIQTAYSQLAEKHSAPPPPARPPPPPRSINFDCYSKDAWHVLNTSSYTKLSSSKQYEFAGDAADEVNECVRAIDALTQANSPFSTKLSALATIRKIIKTILLADDTLGHEVRKDLQWDDVIPATMVRILKTMSEEERKRAGQSRDEKGSLLEKVEAVADDAADNMLGGLSDLDEVLELLGDESGTKREYS